MSSSCTPAGPLYLSTRSALNSDAFDDSGLVADLSRGRFTVSYQINDPLPVRAALPLARASLPRLGAPQARVPYPQVALNAGRSPLTPPNAGVDGEGSVAALLSAANSRASSSMTAEVGGWVSLLQHLVAHPTLQAVHNAQRVPRV